MGELVSLEEFRNKQLTKCHARYETLMDRAEEFEERGLNAFKDAVVKNIIENNKQRQKYGATRWEAPVPMGNFNNRTECALVPPEMAEYLVTRFQINDCPMP